MQHTVLAKAQASSLAGLDVVLHKLSPGHNDLSFAQFCHVVVVTTEATLKRRGGAKAEPARVLGRVVEGLAGYVSREGRELDPHLLAAARAVALESQSPNLDRVFGMSVGDRI